MVKQASPTVSRLRTVALGLFRLNPITQKTFMCIMLLFGRADIKIQYSTADQNYLTRSCRLASQEIPLSQADVLHEPSNALSSLPIAIRSFHRFPPQLSTCLGVSSRFVIRGDRLSNKVATRSTHLRHLSIRSSPFDE
jgi:hypothetical protein